MFLQKQSLPNTNLKTAVLISLGKFRYGAKILTSTMQYFDFRLVFVKKNVSEGLIKLVRDVQTFSPRGQNLHDVSKVICFNLLPLLKVVV